MERNILRNGRIAILCRFSSGVKPREQEKSYYFVGSAVALDDVRESVNRSENGRESKVVVSTLKLLTLPWLKPRDSCELGLLGFRRYA